MTPQTIRSGLIAAIVAVATVGVGLALIMPLLALRMQMAGFSSSFIGISTAVGGAATVLSAPLVPGIAQRIGVQKILLCALLLGMISMLAFGLIDNIYWWIPWRFAFGVSLTIIFIMSEYWINALAPPERRGIITGIYASALALGFALGPSLLSLIGTAGLLPFFIGIALFALAGVPIVTMGAHTPQMHEAASASLKDFLSVMPIATFAAFAFGVVEMSGVSLLPVYAVGEGFSESRAALAVSAFAFGGVLLEIPIGYLSDYIDRRRMMLLLALVGACGALLIPLSGGSFIAFALSLLIWGGFVGSIYPIALALLGTHYRDEKLITANAALIMFYSMGGLIGPPAMGVAMDWCGPAGLFWAVGGAFLIYIAFIMSRGRNKVTEGA